MLMLQYTLIGCNSNEYGVDTERKADTAVSTLCSRFFKKVVRRWPARLQPTRRLPRTPHGETPDDYEVTYSLGSDSNPNRSCCLAHNLPLTFAVCIFSCMHKRVLRDAEVDGTAVGNVFACTYIRTFASRYNS